MKLHLPKGLLVAVLAACGMQPVAATIVQDDTAKTYTVTGGDSSDSDNAISPPTSSDYQLIFQITAANTDDRNYFAGATTTTHAGSVQIGGTGSEADDSQGLIITNGNSSQHGIFTGAVTGTGILKRTGNANTALTFSGDVTEYVGNIYLGGGAGYTFTLTFGGKDTAVAAASTTNTKGASGSGNITIASKTNSLVYNYTKGNSPVYIANAISESSGVDGSTVTLKGGADYVFSKTVSVDKVKLEGGSLALGNCDAWGNANVRSTIEVLGGAVLKTSSNDQLGYGANKATEKIILTGSSESSLATFELGGRQTMTTELNMNGHAQVTAVGEGSGDKQPGLNAFRQNGAIINVTGTNNTIAAALQTRDSFHITVEDGGSLLVSGEVRGVGSGENGYAEGGNPYGYETGSVVKLGDGSLEFTYNENTFIDKYFNMGGSTVFTHAENATATHTFNNGMRIAAGSVTVDSGTTAVLGKVIEVWADASLIIDGKIQVKDLTGFSTVYAGGTLSDGMNGFRSDAKESYLIIDAVASSTVDKADATIEVTGKTSEDLFWDNNSLLVSTGNTQQASSTIYEVVNTTGGAVEYSSSDSKWSTATGIRMDSGTALKLNSALNDNLQITLRGDYANAKIQVANGVTTHHSKITTTGHQTVSYELDGATLNLSGCAQVTNITALDLSNGAKLAVHDYNNTLGSETSRVQIKLSGASTISLQNGSSFGGSIWSDIFVNGSGSILGSVYGGETDVKGSITGSGTLNLGRSSTEWNDSWKISALISDGETGKLSLVYDAANGNQENANAVSTLTLSGANTYSGGTTITAGKIIVTSGGTLGTGDVTVNGGELEINGNNVITGSQLSITNGTVTANYSSNGGDAVIGYSTKVNIGAGGTLKLSGRDSMGWGGDSRADIVLGGSASAIAKLDIQDYSGTVETVCTFSNGIVMNGNAEITGTALSTFGIQTDIPNGTDADVQGSRITVSGTNNKITTNRLELRRALEIAIAKDAVLTVDSLLFFNANNNDATADRRVTKSGDGVLELTNSGNTWNKVMHVTGGTLRLVGAANLPGSVTMDSNTRLEAGTGTIGNLTMAGGSTLDADNAVTLNGTLTFNGLVNLDGAIKDALYSGEKTVSLFTGVTSLVLNGTTYDSTARVAYNPVDLEEVFTFEGQGEHDYQLHYSGGELFASLSIPEPATATLSLLALAGLCARRRRKS